MGFVLYAPKRLSRVVSPISKIALVECRMSISWLVSRLGRRQEQEEAAVEEHSEVE